MKVRKEITLPSGATVTIRPPSMLDVLEQNAPDGNEPIERTAARVRRCILACTGTIRWANPPRAMRLVEKQFDQCLKDEITVEDLDDADVHALLDAIAALRKETAVAVETFPEGVPQATDERRPAGEAIPSPADAGPSPAGT